MTGQELLTEEKSVEWVKYLPKLIDMMNEHYELKQIKLTPAQRIADPVTDKLSRDLLDEGTLVRYLLDKPIDMLSHAKLHGSFREGDIKWSIKPTTIERLQIIPNQPIFYKLKGLTPLYTRPQLQVITDSMKLPEISPKFNFKIKYN